MRPLLFAAALLATAPLPAQTARTFETLTYTAPSGFTEVRKPDGGGRVELTKFAGVGYCQIVIYAGTPASDSLEASFDAEWKAVALKTISPVPTPRSTVSATGQLRTISGTATSTAGGQPATAMLLVLDGGHTVFSIVILTPTPAALHGHRADIDSFIASLSLPRGPAPPPTSGGKLTVPPPPANITIADLAGDWGHNDGITTTYVDRHTGAYAGTESIHFTNKWAFTKEGGISLDFFGIRNGKKIVEKSTGTAALSGGVLVIRMTNMQRYVFRGWLELPDMTIMKLNGPWYEAPIPANIFTNPEQGANLDQNWVRKK